MIYTHVSPEALRQKIQAEPERGDPQVAALVAARAKGIRLGRPAENTGPPADRALELRHQQVPTGARPATKEYGGVRRNTGELSRLC